jgi:hypothetical protein
MTLNTQAPAETGVGVSHVASPHNNPRGLTPHFNSRLSESRLARHLYAALLIIIDK